MSSNVDPVIGKTPSPPNSANNREKIKTWVKEPAQNLNKLYFSAESTGSSHPALGVLNQLCTAAESLGEFGCFFSNSPIDIICIIFCDMKSGNFNLKNTKLGASALA